MKTHNRPRYRSPEFWQGLSDNLTEISAGNGVAEAAALVRFAQTLATSREVVRVGAHVKGKLTHRMRQIEVTRLCLEKANSTFRAYAQSDGSGEQQVIAGRLRTLNAVAENLDDARSRLRRNMGLPKYES